MRSSMESPSRASGNRSEIDLGRKRPVIDHLSAIAEPTMACMFGNGKPKENDKIPKDGAPKEPPMDLVP